MVDRKLNFAGGGLSVGPMPIRLNFSSLSAFGAQAGIPNIGVSIYGVVMSNA